jgi:hypothetical protein
MTTPHFELSNLEGLSTAELLLLPEAQRQTIAWMLQQGTVTFLELVSGLPCPEAEMRTILTDLIGRGVVEEIEIGSDRYYRLRLIASGNEATAFLPTMEPGKPLAVILNSSGGDRVTPGSVVELGVTIRNKGNQSAVIDVFIDDLPPVLRQWCSSTQERLALGAKQSGEVIFRFQVPVEASPETYFYLLVVDSPNHYQEYTPIRYPQTLQVLPALQDVVRVSDPTFSVQPATSTVKSLPVQPGEIAQLQVAIHNRSDRVDRFRVTCVDLSPDWFTFTYPQATQGQGIAVDPTSLDLNPGAQGIVLLMIHPPVNAIANIYVPTIRLHSENNPQLSLLDLIYLKVLPIYQMQVELRSLVTRIRREPGLFALQLANSGNTERTIKFNVLPLDGGNLCDYAFEPLHLKLHPQQTLTSRLQVKPKNPWKRPFWGGGRLLNFSVELADPEQLPLPPVPMQSFVLWEARPWWQLLPFLLGGVAGLLLLVWTIWWLLFRPPIAPQVVRFFPEDTAYSAENEDFIHLGFQINHPEQVQAIELVGLGEDGTVLSEPVLYDWSQGVPASLRPFCFEQSQSITCRNIRTDASKAGKYVFTLKLIPKSQQLSPELVTAVPAMIAPILPPQILAFTPTQPIYSQAPPRTVNVTESAAASSTAARPILNPDEIALNWAIAHPKKIRALQLLGQDAKGNPTTPAKTYDFAKGIPAELKPFCAVEKQQLLCRNVRTGVKKVGEYQFVLQVIPQGEPPKEAIASTTEIIKIAPPPPRILALRINGKEALAKYLLPIVPGQLVPKLVLTWEVENNEGTQVELLPTPGTVSAKGSIPLMLAPEAGEMMVTLQVTNAAGEQVMRSLTIQTFNATAGLPSSSSPRANSPGGSTPVTPPPRVDQPTPIDPRTLSPTELPPQFN